MPFYRERPAIVEAMRLPDENEIPSPELIAWLKEREGKWAAGDGGAITVQTGAGAATAHPGDWIAEDRNGDLSPWDPDDFARRYEKI